jgi:hypothetical protein
LQVSSIRGERISITNLSGFVEADNDNDANRLCATGSHLARETRYTQDFGVKVSSDHPASLTYSEHTT